MHGCVFGCGFSAILPKQLTISNEKLFLLKIWGQ